MYQHLFLLKLFTDATCLGPYISPINTQILAFIVLIFSIWILISHAFDINFFML
jgi:hypothetical protein